MKCLHHSPALKPPIDVVNPRVKYALNCDIVTGSRKIETYMINLIKKAVEVTGCKNVVISGGCV